MSWRLRADLRPTGPDPLAAVKIFGERETKMLSRLSTEHLARASAERPKRTIVAWVLAVVISVGLVATLFDDAVTTEFAFLNNPESKQANTLLEERLRGPADVKEVVIVTSDSSTVDDPTYRDFVESLHSEIEGLGSDVVAEAGSYYQTGDESMVSDDRRSTILSLVMAGNFKDAETSIGKVHDILDARETTGGFELFITGGATYAQDFLEGNQKDLEKGEAVGMPIALIILAVVFGAVAAAVLPMVLAIGSIAIAVGLAVLIGQAFELNAFVQNIITMIGLAVGIDYALLTVSRYREERARGLAKLDAISAVGATASRTVLFSGMTVGVALLGLLVVPHSVTFSIGLGAILVVTVAVTATLTLLPAVLSVMGDKVNSLRVPLITRKTAGAETQGGAWDRIARVVMRRPVISMVLAAGLLIAATVPYFSINTGTSGVSTFLDGFRAKEGFTVLQREFGLGLNAPAEVVLDGDVDSAQVQAAVAQLQQTLESDSAFGASSLQVNDSGDLALLSAPLVGDATAEPTIEAVRRLRDDYVPAAFTGAGARVLVTGIIRADGKTLSRFMSDDDSFDRAYLSAITRGVDNPWLNRFKNFRAQIADEVTEGDLKGMREEHRKKNACLSSRKSTRR